LTTEAFGLTDVGRKRQHNEDAMLVDTPLGLYVVADGMGGHAAGEVASNRATEVVKQHITANRHLLKDLGNNPTADSRSAAAALVEVAVQRACADIYRTAMTDASKRGMGTTFVCLAVGGNKGVIGHVGDSRVYLVRHGQCHRLTEDHTLVAAQLKAGTITKEQAAASQYRNVITRAVGIQESVQVDTLIVDLVPGDVFILCSDGLHGYMEDEEILPLVSGMAPGELPKRLIDIANERGGKDSSATSRTRSRRRCCPSPPRARTRRAGKSWWRASRARSSSSSSAAGWPSRRTGWRSPSCARAATSERWGSSTTRRAPRRCGPPSPRAPWSSPVRT
jgi:serine/threonine protein phosphatase PrpC